MSTYTISGQVTFIGSGTGINGVTVIVTRVSGTADASSPYVFTTSGSGINAGKYTGATLVTGTVYSVVATDSALTFSTIANITVATSNFTGQNFTLTPTISVSPTSFAFAAPAGQELQITATVGNDVTGTASWASNHTNIATVNSSGLVTVVGPGSVTITATVTDDTSVGANCSITIGTNVQVSLSPTSINLLQNLLQAQIQAGYADQPFTSSQSTDLLNALAQLRGNV